MGIRIERVLNNNAVVSKDKEGNEVVLIGAGIAFQKKYGGYVSESKVEKTYRLEGEEVQNNFSKLIAHIPQDYFDIVEGTVELSQAAYEIELNSSLLVSLSDHIYNAVKREREGVTLDNGLLWEIKQIYGKEFEIGQYMVKSVNKTFDTRFDDNEAAFIAMHILDNKKEKMEEESVNETITLIKEIQHILMFHFKTNIDEESIDFYRLITHLKFFVQRMTRKENRTAENETLYLMITKSYPESTKAVKKVRDYLQTKYNYQMTNAEQTYLIIHIANLFEKG